MKKFFVNLIISSIYVFISSFVVVMIVSAVTRSGAINSSLNDNIMIVIGLITFLIFGFVFGYRQKEKGLICGFIFAVAYAAIVYTTFAISKDLTTEKALLISSKALLIIIGSILGVNFGRRKIKS